jgi:hypothetical protein
MEKRRWTKYGDKKSRTYWYGREQGVEKRRKWDYCNWCGQRASREKLKDYAWEDRHMVIKICPECYLKTKKTIKEISSE